MKPKNLVILALVVVALLAYILLFERHQPTSDEARRNADKVFGDLDEQNVTALQIDRNGLRIRLEKAAGTWRLREPMDYPADGPTVDSTVTSLLNLSADRRLSAGEVDPAEYGLDAPEAEIMLLQADGTATGFAVGAEMALGSKRPLRISGSDEILVIPGWFMGDLEREVDDWRSREVTNVRADQVVSIDIGAGDDSIRAVRIGSEWRLLSPVEDLADRDHLEGLISDLGSLRIDEFLDPPIDDEVLGLNAPEYSLVVLAEGLEPLRLELGNTREGDGGTQVACRRGDGDYFWALDRVRTRLSKAPVLWRSKKVAPFDAFEIEGLMLSTPEDAVELERVDFQWQFAGDGAAADQSRVTDRINALSELEATDYDLMAPITAEVGRARIALRSADDGGQGRTIELTFFQPLSEGGRAMVRVSDRDTIMGIEPDVIESVFGEFEILRQAAEPAEE